MAKGMVLLFRTGKFTVIISIVNKGLNLLTIIIIGKPRGYTLIQLVELVKGLLVNTC